MGLVSLTPPRRVAVPNDDGQWIDIRKLSGRQLADAKEERELRVLRRLREMGGDVVAHIQELQRRRDDDDVRQAAADPLNDYDIDTLIRHGIKGWSYELECKPRHFEELDEATREHVARELLEFARPRTSAERDELFTDSTGI